MSSDILLPPAMRTPLWEQVTKGAIAGQFVLPKCNNCGAIQYPPQEICRNCLSTDLEWVEVESVGKVLAFTSLHASLEGFFREHVPWSIAFVKLDSGPRLYTHISKTIEKVGQRVKVLNVLDKSGQAVFISVSESDGINDYLNEFEHLLLKTKEQR